MIKKSRKFTLYLVRSTALIGYLGIYGMMITIRRWYEKLQRTVRSSCSQPWHSTSNISANTITSINPISSKETFKFSPRQYYSYEYTIHISAVNFYLDHTLTWQWVVYLLYLLYLSNYYISISIIIYNIPYLVYVRNT